ncbi:autotransporter domain-containing protein [Rickettsia endosymbiont of Gonocerus acuteangulatus]|uniref:autotransporter outer membrane beta-barrel domain-containing protein n=1 Tax=Rickettsia endosymbiont of Gonocerus acuteangulatus TaxID=3066266 RepID=UPI003132D4ED
MTLSYIYNIRNEVLSTQNNTTNNYTNFPKHKSFRSRIKQVATVSLIFLSMITGEVFAGDKRPKSKASSGRKQEVTFESINLSSSLPDVVPTLPLPDLISNPPVIPPPLPPLPDIVPPVILPDVVPVPPAPPAPPMASSQPHLLSDTTFHTKPKSGFMAAMKEIARGNFKLKKVKKAQKEIVVSSDKADFMSQILARREAIAGEQQNKKCKKAAKQVIVLNAEEEKAREAEIAKKIAENKEKAATLRKQKSQEWEENRKKILAEVEVENQRRAAEAAKAIREQKAKESGIDSRTAIAGIDPVLHNNIVADLRQEIISLKEQLTVKSNVVSEGTGDLASSNYVISKRSLEGNRIVETKDQSTSTEDLIVLEDRLYDEKLKNWEFEEDKAVKKLDEVISTYSDSDSGYDDEALEDSSIASSISISDTNAVVSEEELQSKPIVSEIVQDELVNVEKELQSQKLKEEEEVEAVEDILGEDLITDTVEQVDANNSTARHQEVLAERTRFAARVREDLRFSSKAVSKQIRHRLLTREIGNMVAVAAGDEEQEQAPSYSVWSSGIFGGSKQKEISTALGYSSRIRGGSIGGEINLNSDLMFGASLSRLHSTVKYLPMLNSNQNVSKTNTNIFSVYSSATLAANTNLQTLASVALSGKHGKKQDIFKPKSKLFSFESHLNQKIRFQNNITLIPSIGFRYEYGRVGTSRDIIRDSYVLHHKKSKNSTLSGEIGTRVLFTPINFSSDFKLIPTAHISLDKRIRGSKHNSGQLISIKDIGGEASVVSANSQHEKLSTNIGGGLIASHKNMALEFLYDMQKQRSFKSHQGILKLKVNL